MIPEPEVYGGPFFVPDLTGTKAPVLTLRQIAAALAGPGVDKEQTHERLKAYLRNGWMTPAGRIEGDHRGTHVFGPDQALVGATLCTVAEFGVKGTEPMAAAGLGLSVFAAGDLGLSEADLRAGKRAHRDAPRSPAAWAMREFAQGVTGFTFQLAAMLHGESGHLMWTGRVFNTESDAGPNLHVPTGYILRALLAVPLDPIMHRLWQGPRRA